MSGRARDAKGRFVKRPKPPPLDPELVRTLGEAMPAIRLFRAQDWQLVIQSKHRYTYETEEL